MNMMQAVGQVGSFMQTSGNLTAELLEAKDWSAYHGMSLEMIACRKGRNLFPYLKFRLTGLDQNQMYYIFLELRRIGNKRFSYDAAHENWSVADEEESLPGTDCVYESDISPKMGHALNGLDVSFKHVKLVNTKQDKPESSEQLRKHNNPKIFVHTKCFYQPYLLVTTANQHGKPGEGSITYSFCFPLTRFVTVTAYRNNRITQLKIQHNPKARAFKIKKEKKMMGHSNMEDQENAGYPGPKCGGGGYNDQFGSMRQLSMTPAPEFMYAPQNGAAMYGYHPGVSHYGYHPHMQASAHMIQPQMGQLQDMNAQNATGYYEPPPLHYNNTDANLLPVATQQQQQQQHNYIDEHIQSFASAMPATNGEAAGPYYVQAPQQQAEYVGVEQQQQHQFGNNNVPTSSSADIVQLSTLAHNSGGYPIINNVECFPAQPQTNNNNQFIQLATTPTMVDTSVATEQQHNVWEGAAGQQQQQHYQPLEQANHQQYYPVGYDTAPSNGAVAVNNSDVQL